MREIPIGLVIKEIAAEKNLKMARLVEISGKSRQGMYVVFGRSEMNNSEIEEWAKILGVTQEYLFDRWKNANNPDANTDSNYLLEHLTSLETQFKNLLDQLNVKDRQLDVKDRQIEKLMDLLGKHKDVIQLRASREVMKLYPEIGKTA